MATVPRPPSRQPLPPHAQEVYKGDRFSVFSWQQKMFDGTEQTFEKIKGRDSVTVLPFLPNGDLILTKQEQPGIPLFLSTAGGIIDDGEDPEAAALRELQEETGYTCQKMILFHAAQPIGKMEWVNYLYVALGCTKTHEQNLDAGEKIELFTIPMTDFLTYAKMDEFRNWDTALLFLRHPEKLEELINLTRPQG